MPTCTSCGHDNREGARFCDACGEPLAAAPPERFRKTVTVLFSDVVGSTALGERLDPETLSSVMTAYFETIKPLVEHHGGRLEKFIGDAVVAVFGVPIAHEDDALRAVRVALDMRSGLASLNSELDSRFGVTIDARTGINTGVVAATAREGHHELVFGDTANVAARLQQIAAGGEILLSDATYRLVREAVAAELLPPLELKGKTAPATVHRLLGALSEVAPRRLDADMIGRDEQLDELLAAFREAVESRSCRIVTVVGEPGVGKSRLVRELVKRVASEASVLPGRCLPYGKGITYWPLAQMVRRAAGIDEHDSRERAVAKLAELAGDAVLADRIAGLVGLSDAPVGPGEAPLAARSLFETLARARPVVAVLDDVHWAEQGLLDLVEHVAAEARDAPLLLVCMARPELLETRPDWAPLIALSPLSADESSLLVEALLREGVLTDGLRGRIERFAGGNPLFLEQMASMLVDEGVVVSRDGRWLAQGDLAEVTVPPSIEALLSARVDLLSPDERALLGRAAVVGQLVYRGALEELSPEPERARLDATLQALVRRQLVQPERSDLGGEDAFSFRHLLIRDVAYGRLTKEDRAELHERFAGWLERTTGERAAEVAEILGYHLEQARRCLAELRPLDERARSLGERGAERLAEAGRRAFGRGDSIAFGSLLDRAVALVDPDHPRRPALLVELGGALRERSRFEEAESVLREALERGCDPRTEMLARLALLQIQERVDPQIDHARIEADARRAAAFFEEAGDDGGAAVAWRLLFRVAWTRGQADAAREAAERALASAERAGDPRRARDSVLALGAMANGATPTSTALAWGEEQLESVRGHRGAEAGIRFHLACLSAMRGDFDRAREFALLAIAGHEELGNPVSSAADRANGLAWFVERLRGDWTAAERELRQAYEDLTARGETYVSSAVAGWLAHCLYHQDRDAEADEFAQLCADVAPADLVGCQVLWRTARAKVLARGGGLDEAEALARGAVELAQATDSLEVQADALLDLAEVSRRGGRSDAARVAAREALERYEQKEHLVGAAAARRLLGELERARPAVETASE